ncbi:AAA family ATPase [Limosilactobacillus panis]|uniref:AAA family ATPase n=1 Tax=Limosilactobacillus panis TaxID=47493 RepID=UPI001C972263|nr:AAA family ATPase [Limosilactobacillus panis]QZN92945.1 AAA family ATPase [Limosilactobacillus panis]
MALTYQQLLTAVPLVMRAGNVPNIVGDAGIGKSALVNEVARKVGAALFTTVVSLSEKGDLAIPVPPLTSDSFVETANYGRLANVQFGYSATLVQIIKQAEAKPDQPIIWFLDEFNRGSQAVQSELMNLVLQRQINALRLPDQVHIVIAENPDSSMAGFSNREYDVAVGDAAIRDRTVRLVMTTSTDEWMQWAQQRGLNQLVINYLRVHPTRLSIINPESEDLQPTPRAWERVARNLDQLQRLPSSSRQELATDLFSGDLGEEVGTSFAEFVLAQGNELTLEKLRASSAGAAKFAQADEATKFNLLRDWLKKDALSLATETGAAQFNNLLAKVSPDGQVAITHSVGEKGDRLLEKMYQVAKQQLTGQVAALYQRLGQIATREDRH